MTLRGFISAPRALIALGRRYPPAEAGSVCSACIIGYGLRMLGGWMFDPTTGAAACCTALKSSAIGRYLPSRFPLPMGLRAFLDPRPQVRNPPSRVRRRSEFQRPDSGTGRRVDRFPFVSLGYPGPASLALSG